MFSRQLFRLSVYSNTARQCMQVQVCRKGPLVVKCASSTSSRNDDDSIVPPAALKLKKSHEDSEGVYLYSRRDVNIDDPILLDARTQLQLADLREKLKEQNSGTPEQFSYFNLPPSTIQKLQKNKIEKLFPVQHKSFSHIIDGHDVVVQARTGTGKTLAFVLPLLENLQSIKQEWKRGRPPVILVLEPTRELAIQTANEFKKFKNNEVNVGIFYGGTSYNVQEMHLQNGIDVLVGTPGRILDHVKSERLDLSHVKHVVLDEADRMLGMGFQEELDEILSYSYTEENKPQTLLFSATMPTWIQNMAAKYMHGDAKIVDLIGSDEIKAATTVEHKAIRCAHQERPSTLNKIVKFYCGSNGRAIVFTQTKREADDLVRSGVLAMGAEAIHGDRSQRERENTLNAFRNGKIKCLVATDVASRGLDIPEVDLVVQTEPPTDLDNYIHRSGRTGRAGKTGLSVIFFDNRSHYYQLLDVQKRAGIKFKQIQSPTVSDLVQSSMDEAARYFQQLKKATTEKFLSQANVLLESDSREDLVAELLSVLSGTTKLVDGSRLGKMLNDKSEDISFRVTAGNRCLEESDPFGLDMLRGPAKEVLKKDDPTEEIAACCAFISFGIKQKQRSLLTSRMGYLTLSIDLRYPAYKVGHFWWMLRSNFDADMVDTVTSLKMRADRMGCVFDIPVSVGEDILDSWSTKNIRGQLTVASQIPELEETYGPRGYRSNYRMHPNSGRDYNNRQKFYGQRNYGSRENYRNKNDSRRTGADDSWEF